MVQEIAGQVQTSDQHFKEILGNPSFLPSSEGIQRDIQSPTTSVP
jgi:hypothetical protein